ncbi:hypothetical protein [Akkermansia sp.]|uniref:hypothetical protein n=1 Tax=Akkermansia sp. TaxID=1872421 RepID=UPI003AAC3B88
MSKKVIPFDKLRNWRSLSDDELRSFHTVFDDYSPNMNFGALVLIDNKENSFCILRLKIETPEHHFLPSELFERCPSFLLILEGLKTAYFHLLLELQLLSSILPKEYSHLEIVYTPSSMNRKLSTPDAWEKWRLEHPGKQPFVDYICLVDNNERKIGWNVSQNSSSNVYSPLKSPLHFIEHLRMAVISYNKWLKIIFQHNFIVIPGNFISDTFELDCLIQKDPLPIIEF